MLLKYVNNGGRIALILLGTLLSDIAIAEKPSFAGQSKDERHNNQRNEQHQYSGNESKLWQKRNNLPMDGHYQRQNQTDVHIYFNDAHRSHIHEYYAERYHAGRCPPGLSKRYNNCIPPGHQKKWRKGYPLPRDVIFYDLPPRVSIQLGPPPPHHRYVRVAADILLIAIGTGIVVDAIDDLGR